MATVLHGARNRPAIMRQGNWPLFAAYTGCQEGGKPVICKLSRGYVTPPFREHEVDGLFRIEQILGALSCGILLALSVGLNIAAARFRTGKLGQARLRIGARAASADRPKPPRRRSRSARSSLARQAPTRSGQTLTKNCAACHTFNKGGAAVVGPNLWGVVGRAKGVEAGFGYSDGAQGQGRQVDHRRAQRLHHQSQGL